MDFLVFSAAWKNGEHGAQNGFADLCTQRHTDRICLKSGFHLGRCFVDWARFSGTSRFFDKPDDLAVRHVSDHKRGLGGGNWRSGGGNRWNAHRADCGASFAVDRELYNPISDGRIFLFDCTGSRPNPCAAIRSSATAAGLERVITGLVPQIRSVGTHSSRVAPDNGTVIFGIG